MHPGAGRVPERLLVRRLRLNRWIAVAGRRAIVYGRGRRRFSDVDARAVSVVQRACISYPDHGLSTRSDRGRSLFRFHFTADRSALDASGASGGVTDAIRLRALIEHVDGITVEPDVAHRSNAAAQILRYGVRYGRGGTSHGRLVDRRGGRHCSKPAVFSGADFRHRRSPQWVANRARFRRSLRE